MKLTLRITWIACAPLVCLLAWQCAAAADVKTASQPKAAAATNPAPAVLEAPIPIPKSYFTNAPSNLAARDPFFPTSPRRRPKPPAQTNGPEKASGDSIVSKLVCKGIMGTGANAVAMIGGIGSGIRSFSANETKDYELPGGSITVQCTEINTVNPTNKYVVVIVGKELTKHVLRLSKPRPIK